MRKRKEKLTVEYLDSLKPEDFKLEEMMTQQEWEELQRPTNFLDESEEAWRVMSDEERKAVEDFEASFESNNGGKRS